MNKKKIPTISTHKIPILKHRTSTYHDPLKITSFQKINNNGRYMYLLKQEIPKIKKNSTTVNSIHNEGCNIQPAL